LLVQLVDIRAISHHLPKNYCTKQSIERLVASTPK
jgi:hypothetical protein